MKIILVGANYQKIFLGITAELLKKKLEYNFKLDMRDLIQHLLNKQYTWLDLNVLFD